MVLFQKPSVYTAFLIILIFLLAACSSEAEPTPQNEVSEAPSESTDIDEEAEADPEEDEDIEEEPVNENAVVVEDQILSSDNTVTVSSVTADTNGWLVIHAQAEGNPGPVVGTAPVSAGVNNAVVVEIDPASATETLYAMLHVDAGSEGEYEFPGDDVPATDADGNVVTPSFSFAFPNRVTVEEQELAENGTVTITEVVSTGPGWLVIHAQADGKPGPILGATLINAGINSDVAVEIDTDGATEVLYAMLHVDAGSEGQLEFPGDDVPAIDADGNVVTPSFAISGSLPVAEILLLAESPELGPYLTGAAGMSLYTFAFDVPGTSNCYDRCAQAWPPLLVDAVTELPVGEGIPGELGTTERDDGTIQVTYEDWPLYYWINDEVPGDTKGHKVNNVWAVAYPTTHVFLGGNEELGSFLVGPESMTLYRFNPDQPGVSNCDEGCAAIWPPFTVAEGELPRGNAGVVGDLATTERDDGAFQVTYQGMPLYHWINDEVPGDATGHEVNDVWFVVPPFTVGLGESEELGSFLVGANRMTLYLFTVDEENLSNCYDQCSSNWPPLLVQEGEIPVPGAGVTGEFNVTTRDDGAFQVTYNGQPLYFWGNDENPGDTTGHGVNDVWFVVEP
jgi:predicted lipoprotein with Yx(FWY)xxD motif